MGEDVTLDKVAEAVEAARAAAAEYARANEQREKAAAVLNEAQRGHDECVAGARDARELLRESLKTVASLAHDAGIELDPETREQPAD